MVMTGGWFIIVIVFALQVKTPFVYYDMLIALRLREKGLSR